MAKNFTRRDLLKNGGVGFGYMAFSALAAQASNAKINVNKKSPVAARDPHFSPRAKRVIFMFMQGGPSHVDTFDYKPELIKYADKSVDFKYNEKAFKGKLLPPQWPYQRHGKSGLPISDLYPNLAKHADDLCLLNGMHSSVPAHPQATILLHTGSVNLVRPSVGSWVLYGLGSENENLPGFVTLNPLNRLGGTQNYGSAFLPATYQGTRINVGATPIRNIKNPSLSRTDQRKQLDLIQSFNHEALRRGKVDSQVEGVIESYELAFKMQDTVPTVMNINEEPEQVKSLYGLGEKATENFGRQCLMARRLAEAGVRFIEVTHQGWDQHNGLKTKLPANCNATDKPIAGLITDLKLRGLFDDTLIVWGGEFGRTPAEQNNGNGRRHNSRGYTMWMAGGGVKGGIRYGATDPTGFDAVENKVHIHDLHATILHLMGLDHEQLTYNYAGRDFRLTDVYGNVVQDIIA